MKMLSDELGEKLEEFVKWIETNNIKSFYPKDVAEKFNLNDESVKRLIRKVKLEVSEFDLIPKGVDGKILVKI